MRALLTAIALVAAWWLGRDHERRQVRAMDERADEMDGVQWDPWGLHEGSVIPIAHFDSVTAWARGRANDLTYEQALTQHAIRSTQRDDVTTEGTS
jgi:hypothetical protein